MSLTSSLHPHKLFLHDTGSLSLFSKPSTPLHSQPHRTPNFLLIKVTKSMQGRVVCSTDDKTVSVEVVRLAPHPKYKRRVRKKKKFQAHDPDNTFNVGDFVQLEKCKPISKTRLFCRCLFRAGMQQRRRMKRPRPWDFIGVSTAATAAG